MAHARNIWRCRWRRRRYAASWLICVVAFGFPSSQAETLEGFGASTPGGNGGAIATVTSLADSGPGSLRAALAGGDNRRIVFAVAGTITLTQPLELRDRAFLTVDGATAPEPGVTLRGHMLYIRRSHDIIVRHLRVRESSEDGILIWDNSYNVVLDHCSVTNASDENISITEGTHDVTVSWSLIGDTRPHSRNLHTKGMLIANARRPPVTRVSLHHNLFVNQAQRSPQVSSAGLVDIRNNVIWGWAVYGIRLRGGAFGNIVNNVFHTTIKPDAAVVLTDAAGSVYIHGNQGPKTTNVNALSTASQPFPVAAVSTACVAGMKVKVQNGVGASPRDALDAALVDSLVTN